MPLIQLRCSLTVFLQYGYEDWGTIRPATLRWFTPNNSFSVLGTPQYRTVPVPPYPLAVMPRYTALFQQLWRPPSEPHPLKQPIKLR